MPLNIGSNKDNIVDNTAENNIIKNNNDNKNNNIENEKLKKLNKTLRNFLFNLFTNLSEVDFKFEWFTKDKINISIFKKEKCLFEDREIFDLFDNKSYFHTDYDNKYIIRLLSYSRNYDNEEPNSMNLTINYELTEEEFENEY